MPKRKFTKAEAAERHRVKNRERMREVRNLPPEKPPKVYPPSALTRQIAAVLRRKANS
jgi:hypothetical protein